MSDIVERLNIWRETPNEGDPMIDALLSDIPEAADEITALRKRVEALEGAFNQICALDIRLRKRALNSMGLVMLADKMCSIAHQALQPNGEAE